MPFVAIHIFIRIPVDKRSVLRRVGMKVDYKIDLVGLKTKKTYLTRKYPHIALSRLIYLGAVQFFQHIFSGQNRRA